MKHDEVVDLGIAREEYRACRKCPLPECDDGNPRCPLPSINGGKRKKEVSVKGGDKTRIPVMCFGVVHDSISAACRHHGLSMPAVYAKARRRKIDISKIIEIDVEKKRDGHDNASKTFSI